MPCAMYLIPVCEARPKPITWMYKKFLIKTTSIAFGIALLMAGLFFDWSTASSSAQAQQQAMPTSTLSPFERLAEPTLPARPLQADQGAQDYWLYCLPCHGDRGQGLTEEFRQTYPPDEVNCWQSGCHGKRPYENGFTLPTSIPPLIGTGALQKFENAAILRAYIFAAMPYWKPGSLTEEQSWRVTSFLLRENGKWAAQDELSASNADSLLVGPPRATPTPQPAPSDAAWISAPLLFIVGSIVLILFWVLLGMFRKK